MIIRYNTNNIIFYDCFLGLLLISSLFSCETNAPIHPKVTDGQIDFSHWDFEKNGMVYLNGDWNFYWKTSFQEAKALAEKNEKTGTCYLPGLWSEDASFVMEGEVRGVGIFHVKLLLPDTITAYFLKLNSVYTASEVWVNDRLLSGTGKVGRTAETTVPHFQTQLVELPKTKEIDLFLHIASWEHRRGGGVSDPIIIGTEQQARDEWHTNFMVQFGSFLIITSIGLHLVFLYFFYTEKKSYLYVGLFAIFGVLRAISVDEMVINDMFSHVPYIINQKLRYIGFFMSVGFILLYIYELFKQRTSAYLKWGFYGAVAFSVATVVLPFRLASYISPWFQVLIIPFSLYSLWVIYKSWAYYPVVASFVLIGGCVLFVSMIHTMLIANNIIEGLYYYNIGYVLFIVSQALLLAYLHKEVNEEVNSLASELLTLNKNLELKVNTRTEEIRQQRETLRTQRDQIGAQANKLQAANAQMQALDQAKTRFFANISHELRTPLTLILGALKQVRKQFQRSNANQNYIDLADKYSKQLHHLTNQLLDITKLEARKMSLQLQKESVISVLKNCLLGFEALALQKNINLTFHSDVATYEGVIDRNALEKVMYNLLANAYKFTEEGGQISLRITTTKSHIQVELADTGIGISENQLPHIFDRFYQVGEHQYEGTGIGLALVKELISLHQGTIEVESEQGTGTLFRVTIPTQLSIDQQEIGSPISTAEKTDSINPEVLQMIHEKEVSIVSPSQKEANSTTILLVEDHVDLQALMKENLAAYRVLQAFDGEEGIAMALEHLPDVIISDVMMPKKNGFDLCAALKKDKNTSHIPIILLTARAEHADKLHGLEMGADNYLAKPFDEQELNIRIRNLMRQQRILRERFAKKTELVVFQPTEVTQNPTDQLFMEQLLTGLEDNYTNDAFDVDQLARLLTMNKRSLTKKLKSMLDTSPSKMLQNFRLQKAKELLNDQTVQIGEVCFQVGFSSRSYFTKRFHAKFGETPSEYQESLFK